MMSAPMSVAYVIAHATVKRSQLEPQARIGRIVTVGATPTMPAPSSAAAATPVTSVP